MARSDASRRSVWALIACLAAVVLMLGTTAAFAEGKGKGAGKGKSAAARTESTVTEDNDDDNVPNTPDPAGDSDNRHPSGKDKHAEAGGSGNQGNSSSTPDQDGHGPERDAGGTDKPGGTGGVDELDQDGNNGCGNDDDFEDDNEGLCLGRQGNVDNEETEREEEEDVDDNTLVRGVTVERKDDERDDAQVLGVRFERQAPAAGAVLGADLARTGLALLPMFLVGLALTAAGVATRRRARVR